jgi:arsenate reductase
MITYWHSTRCSKSRAGLAFFQEHGVTLEQRRYMEDAPSRDEVATVLAKLELSAIEMMRPKEKLFKKLGLSADMADHQLLEAMAANPAPIERPIAISDDKAAIGRPTESFAALLA